MALPNFIVAGAERGGTTALCHILRQHPDVYLPPAKETHYFSRTWQHIPLPLYEKIFFQQRRSEQAIGEATPEYMRFADAAVRLRGALGADLKLVFCLREPVRRAFSQYHLRCRLGEETESFERALELEAARVSQDAYLGLRRAYVRGSQYFAQIGPFLEQFPLRNMFFIVHEDDFLNNRGQTIQRLFNFLGIEPVLPVKLDVPSNSRSAPQVHIVEPGKLFVIQSKGGSKERITGPAIVVMTGNPVSDIVLRAPSPGTLAHFRALAENITVKLADDFAAELFERHFRSDVEQLEKLLGRDLSCWRPRP